MQRRDQQGNNQDQTQKNSSFVKDSSFKRKSNEGSSTDIKPLRSGRPPGRPSERSFDEVSVSSANKSNINATEEDNEKLMVLSNQAREALKSMQRFDRFIYVTESQKKLKVPIETELKRLQRIKNSGNKLMKNTFFDNELTITCLFNHMKNLYEIARDLGEIVTLKEQIEVLQQKIIEQNVKFNKDLKQAASGARGKAAEDQQILKDTLKLIDNLISAIKQKNVEKGKKKIQADLKRATDTRRELLELVHNLMGRVGGGAVVETIESLEEGGLDIYQINLNKLIQNHGSAEKNLIFLQCQKSFFEKSIKEAKALDIKNAFGDLKQTATYLIELNTTIKDTEASLLASQKKAVGSALSQQDKQKLKQFHQLQSIINSFEQDGDVWHKQFQVINIKFGSDENILPDLNKNKKLLTSKKQINATVSKLASSYLSLLQLSAKKSQSNTSTKHLEDKYNKVVSANQALEDEVKKLRKQLQSSNSKQQAEVTKFLNLLQQSLTLKEGEDVIAPAQYHKIKKYIDLNRRKMPEDFSSTLSSIQSLIKTIIQNEQHLKQRQLEDQRSEQNRMKQISNIQAILKGLQKIVLANEPLNDGFINKLRKNIEQNSTKIDKLGESPLNNLFRTSNNSIVKLVELLSDTYRTSKVKGGEESQYKHQIDNLRNQLKTKEGQAVKTSKTIAELEAKIEKLNAELQKWSSKDAQFKNQVLQYKRTIATLQKDRSSNQKTIAGLEKDKTNLNKKLEQNESKINQYKNAISEAKQQSKASSSQQQRRNTEINNYRNKIDKYQKDLNDANNQIQNLSQEIEQLNRRLAQTTQQLSIQNIQSANKEEQIIRLNNQIQALKNLNLNLETTIQQMNAEKLQADGKILEITRQNDNLKNRIKIQEQTLTGDKDQTDTLVSQNQRLQQQLYQLNSQYNMVLENYDNGKREFDNLLQTLRNIQLQLNQTKQDYSELSAIYEQTKANQDKNLEIIREIGDQKSWLERELQNLRINYNALEQKHHTQSLRLQQLENTDLNNNNSQNVNSLELSNLKNRVQDLQGLLNRSHLQNSDLHTKINANISQISSLQSQNRNLQNQIRDKSNELQRSKAQKTTTVQVPQIIAANADYQIERYQALKEQNVVLKEQIILRDERIQQLLETSEHGISAISHASSISREQETIRRLQKELHQVKLSNSRDLNKSNHNRLINQNRQLNEAIKIRQINLQNALGDNDYLYKELHRHKEIETDLQSKIVQLNRELASRPLNYGVTTVVRQNDNESHLRRENTSLAQRKTQLESDVKRLEKLNYDCQLQTNNAKSQISMLKQVIRRLQQNQASQKKIIDEIMRSMGTKTNDGNSLMEKKLMELEISIKAMATTKNHDQSALLRNENNELKERVRLLESESRIKRFQDVEDSGKKIEDRLSDLLKQKLQYVKTIKSMQSLLHAKDVKLLQLYDQREADLRNLIHENKKLQQEINRINEKLVQSKVKSLISPKFLEQSLFKMQNELIQLKKQNLVLKEEIQVLEQQLVEREKGPLSSDVKSSSSIGLDRNLYQRVKLLESQRVKLTERVALLNVYQRIQNQSQALVSNVNRLIDGILVFLNESDDFADCDFSNNEFLTIINQSLTNEDYEHYFESVQDLFKDLFFRVVGRKNEVLQKQAQQLLLLRQKMEQLLEQESGYEDDSYSKSFYERPRGRYQENDAKKKASLIALQHLFKLYLKAKDPAVLKEISELLSMSQGKSRYYE